MISKRRRAIIKKASQINDIPSSLLLGVVTLEMTYRKWYHRGAENAATIIGCLVSTVFGYHIKNYTIGHCQVGVATILTYAGIPCYRHSRRVPRIRLAFIKHILRAMTYSGSVDVCAKVLRDLYYSQVMLYRSHAEVYQNVGKIYNGTITYGLLLGRFCPKDFLADAPLRSKKILLGETT